MDYRNQDHTFRVGKAGRKDHLDALGCVECFDTLIFGWNIFQPLAELEIQTEFQH